FFQAEDGIRDFHVTGVQTCALPILLINSCGRVWYAASRSAMRGASSKPRAFRGRSMSLTPKLQSDFACRITNTCLAMITAPFHRSEERRVGEGCRSRRAATE